MNIRKTVTIIEEITSEGNTPLEKPIRRVAAAAIIENPFAGRYVEDLTEMIDLLLADLDFEFYSFAFHGDTELFADTPSVSDHHVGVILHRFNPVFHDFLIDIILVE